MNYLWGGVPPARSTAQAKIDSFEALPDGWHYGSGFAPSAEVRKQASVVLEKMQMLGLGSVHISAGPDGEILLAATSGDDYLSITVEADGSYSFNHEQSGLEVEYAESIARDDLIRRLTSVTEAIWNISGLSTQGHSFANDASSTTWLSRSPSAVACQFLRWNAPLQQVA